MRVRTALAALAGLLAAGAGAALLFLNSASGEAWVARAVSQAASSPEQQVVVGAVENVLSANPVARDIAMKDANGVWLKVDRVSAAWSRLALLSRHVDIDRLDIGKVEVLRLPQSQPARAGEKAEFAWRPDLPVRLRIGQFALVRLTLPDATFDRAAFGVTGSGTAGGARDEARIEVLAKRIDAPGELSLSAALAPQTSALNIAVRAREPAGGVLARLAAIPGRPPVEIALDGAGTPEAFDAKLDARAGDVASATGDVVIRRDGATRRATLDLAGRIDRLAPKELAVLFADATRIEGQGHLGDDGDLKLDRLSLRASAFELTASGEAARDGRISANAALHGAVNAKGAAFRAKKLEGALRISGTRARPAADLSLEVEAAEGPAGRIGRIDLTAKATADGDLSDAAARIDIQVDGAGADLALANAALADALGDKASVSVRARAGGDGETDVGIARLTTDAGEASFTGRAGPRKLDGRLHVSAPDLRRFAGLAGRPLRGAATLRADLSGAPANNTVAATFDGTIASPGLDLPALDGLLGARLLFGGKATSLPDGVAFERVTLRGDHVSAALDGMATRKKADIKASVDLPDLRFADRRLSGRGEILATATGSLEKPDATFSATLRDVRANGRAIPGLTLSGHAQDIAGALSATATLDGLVDGKPASGRVSAARVDNGWKVEPLDLAVGRATLNGALTLDAAGLASGRIRIVAPDLDDLSALALQKMAGRLNADARFEVVDGGQNISVDAQGAGVQTQDVGIDKLGAKFSVRDLYRRPALDGEIAIDAARVGKESISKLRMTAKPATAGAAALDLTMAARGFSVAGRGVLTSGETMRLDIAQFSAQRAGKTLSLAAPASLSLRESTARIEGLSVALGAGRLDVAGQVGETLDLTVRARAVPLSVVSLFDPNLGLDGMLEGEARVSGAASAPAGDWRVRIARATARPLRANGLPAIDVAASGRLAGARTSLDADIALGSASKLKISGSAPLAASGALDLAIRGALDAALANTMLAVNGQTLAGKAAVDLRIAGTIGAPDVGGAVTIADGGFNDPLNGISLSKIAGRLEGRGRELSIPSLVAQTRNGGQILATGRVSLMPDAGMPGTLRIVAKNAQLASTDVVTSTGDLDLTLGGALMRAPVVSGRVSLATMDVNVPDRTPVNLKPLPDTTHIDAKGFAAQILALERAAKAKASRRSGFDAALDLAISAPNRIFVRGRGINAEFGGELKIGGTIQKPTVFGGFDLRRGSLQLLTQRIDISRGKLVFAGGLAPELDFAAETTASDVTARISVTGPAALPVFAFSSSPQLPQDEVLSRLLFARASGSLTAFQGVQLAAALAQFSGVGSGLDAFEKIRKSLGVDSLDIDAGGADGPTIGASRYIMNGVTVGVKTGSKPEQTSVNVGVDVMRGVRVQSETRVDGKTSVGVGVEWEY